MKCTQQNAREDRLEAGTRLRPSSSLNRNVVCANEFTVLANFITEILYELSSSFEQTLQANQQCHDGSRLIVPNDCTCMDRHVVAPDHENVSCETSEHLSVHENQNSLSYLPPVDYRENNKGLCNPT